MKAYLILIFLSLLVIPSLTLAFPGKVIKIKDGDTVIIGSDNGRQLVICRIYGIDAPERDKRGRLWQPYGEDATKELKQLILGRLIEVEVKGKDRYKRSICIIRADNKNIGLEMVKRGYAWAYKQYLKRPYASEYLEAEKEARAKRLGLWQDLNPIPPWEWRKRNINNY